VFDARGGLVVQVDLKQALLDGAIAGAAIDVFESEPSDDSELINLLNLICTPHIGGSSDQAILAMGRSAIKHLVQIPTQSYLTLCLSEDLSTAGTFSRALAIVLALNLVSFAAISLALFNSSSSRWPATRWVFKRSNFPSKTFVAVFG
jgi:hypothetical protein